jgi:hypothetical protein
MLLRLTQVNIDITLCWYNVISKAKSEALSNGDVFFYYFKHFFMLIFSFLVGNPNFEKPRLKNIGCCKNVGFCLHHSKELHDLEMKFSEMSMLIIRRWNLLDVHINWSIFISTIPPVYKNNIAQRNVNIKILIYLNLDRFKYKLNEPHYMYLKKYNHSAWSQI